VLEISEFEDVTRIKMSREAEGNPVYWVAAYLVDGLLIDTGCAHTAEEFLSCLRGRYIHTVVNTHWHEDHIGANRLIQERLGVKIYAHRDSVPLIDRTPVLRPYQEYVWGYPEPSRVDELSYRVDTGRFHFEVLETAGHCRGHIALLEPTMGWCFSGDIFITARPKVIRADEELGGLVATMKRLAGMPTERLVLFTSIGEIIPEGREALRSCVKYLEGMAAKALELERARLSMQEMTQRLLGRESSLGELTGGHFSSLNLVRGLLAMAAAGRESGNEEE
jgi:glyoxylase-like metal-dependent hydrolase (beta-lactamase superfamily II)